MSDFKPCPVHGMDHIGTVSGECHACKKDYQPMIVGFEAPGYTTETRVPASIAKDRCARAQDELATCTRLGYAIKLGEIESGMELFPVPGRVTWRFRPGISSLPSFDFCPYCGERISYP